MKPRSLLFSALALWAASLAPTSAAQFADGSQPGPAGPSGPSRASASSSDSAQAESVVRRYPLEGIVPAIDVTERPFALFMTPGLWDKAYDKDQRAFDATDQNPEVNTDPVVDLLAQALGDDLRFEGRAMEVVDGDLLLMAPEEVQAKAQALLRGLSGAMGARAEVSIDVLTLDGGQLPFPTSASIADDEAQRLIASALERGAEHVRHDLSVTPGNMAVSDLTRAVSIITDYDVEIAQNSGIWDPIRTNVDLGQRIVLRGIPLGDRVQLAGLVRTVDMMGDVKSRPLQARMMINGEESSVYFSDGPEVIQQAEVVMHGYAFSGTAGGGTALVCASELSIGGVRRSQLAILRVTALSGQAVSRTAMGGGQRALLVVNTEAFGSASARTWTINNEVEEYLRYSSPMVMGQLETSKPNFIDEFLNFRFSVTRSVGPWALVVTDPSWDRGGDGELAKIAGSWPRATETKSVALRLVASGVSDAVPTRGLVPTISGHDAAVQVGTARNVIWDYDVEVAGGSSLADPVITAVFAGLGASVSTQGDAIDVEAIGFVPNGPPQTIEVDAKEFRFFDRQDRDTLRVRDRRHLGDDGTASFGATGQGTKRQFLKLEASVR